MSTRPKIRFEKAAAVVLAPYAVQPFEQSLTVGLTTTLDVMNQSLGMTFSYVVT